MDGKFDKAIKNVQVFLAVSVTLMAFALFFSLLFRQVNDTSKDVVLFILGSVSTILTQIISYYFGSSKGADDKTKIISDMTNNKTE